MKRKPIRAFLVCVLLLTVAGFGRAQVIAPPPDLGEEQLVVEILMGLVGNYAAKLQEFQDAVARGEEPDSVMQFRLAAEIDVADGEVDSELDPVLAGISKMAFWVRASVFNSSSGLVKIELSGAFGGMEILATPAESVIISPAESVFSVLPPEMDLPVMIPIDGLLPDDISDIDFSLISSLGLLQDQLGGVLLENVSEVDMEYGGFEMTPKGMAHIVRMVFSDTGEIITLWVLDETWDLCKVGFDDPQSGSSAIIVIEELDFVAAPIPDSAFAVDTTALAELPYEEFSKILDLKLISAALAGTPVAADLAISLPVVERDEPVIVTSDGMDAEDAESALTVQMEYMGPDGVWMPLEAVYVGTSPMGSWEATFLPSELGSYSFRVAYIDSFGAVSETLELLSALDVVDIAPEILDASPSNQEVGVLVSSQIAVVFSQGMDQASVESAFSLTDLSGQMVSGLFDWTDSTVVFSPDQELAYGQDYMITVLGTAASLKGVALGDDFSSTFTTEYASLPTVVESSPTDKQLGVLVSTLINITFTEPMEQASVEGAFSLTDSSGQMVSGTFDWTDSALVFKPDQELAHGQDYVVTVLGTAASLKGAALDADADGIGEGSPDDDFVLRFATERAPLPKVAGFSPADKQLNVMVAAQVSVTFTEAMDQASVESAFLLTSSVGDAAGSFQWPDDNTLTFIPSQDLEYNTTYRVEVRGSALSALGVGLDANGNGFADGSPGDDLSWWFSTEKFPVLAAKPVSQTGLGGDFISVDIVAQGVSQLSSFALTIDFDPTVLKLLKAKRVSFVNWRPRPKIIKDVDLWQPTVIDKEQGLITLAADNTRSGGVTGTGNIATLTFQAIGVGTSPIELKDVSFANALGEAVIPDLRSGQVDILAFAPSDANMDGIVNIHDFILMQNGRGANSDVNGDGVTDMLDMVAAAGNVQTSPASMMMTNELLPNFPNPFNPETWIPYQIIRNDDVVINIYSATGKLVRSMELGYKPAGRYTAKSAAAYWDGNNEDGERVASGIYYYAIKAGNFSAVRKMVVSE